MEHTCPYCGAPANPNHITGTAVMCNECSGWYVVWHRHGSTSILPAQEPDIPPAGYNDRRWYAAVWAVMQRPADIVWRPPHPNVMVRCSRDSDASDVISITISRRDYGVHTYQAMPVSDGVDEFIRRIRQALSHFEV